MIRETWRQYALKPEMIMKRLNNPSQELFTKFFKSEADLSVSGKTSIIHYFQMKVARLYSEDKFSSCLPYKLALKSFKKYSFSKFRSMEIYFEDIDIKFLNGFVAWMTVAGKFPATIGIYLRNLKSIFNDAIKEGVIEIQCYPFKTFAFNSNCKSIEVLYPPQLKQLLNYDAKNEREQKAIAYFFFCYLSNG